MEAEEDDSSKHDEPSLLCVDDGNNLDVKCDTHRELQSNEEQHCVFKSAINETEFPPNTSVESSLHRDAILGDESLVAEMEKKGVAEETEIAEEKAFPNIIEDMAEVKLEIEPDIAEMGLLGQRVFGDVKEDTGAEEEKAVSEFAEGELLNEMVLVGVAESQVEGDVLMANFPENTVGCAETTEKTSLTDVLAEETLAETALFVQDVDVIDATNSVEKTEVEESADDPNDSKEVKVAKQENFSMVDRELGVPVQLVENSDLKVGLVDGAVVEEGQTANLADGTGETLKMENVSSNTDEVGLTNLAGEIDGAGNMENAEDKTVEMDGMCIEDKAIDVADETPENKGVDIADYSIEVLKIENVEDREAGVQGLGVADGSTKVGKIEHMVDETAEAEGVQVTDYTTEVGDGEDKTAQVEEIAMEEETEEADDRVYLVDEGIGSEETDANMTYMVEETEAAEEVEEMDVTEEVDEPSKGSSGAKRKRGKNSKAPARVPSRKKVEEDVCFICFDGGDLVLCDRRLVFQGYPNLLLC